MTTITRNALREGSPERAQEVRRNRNDVVSCYRTSDAVGNPPTLADLAAEPLWVAWKDRDGKKLPMDPGARRAARPNDPTSWGTRSAAEGRNLDGVGIMLGSLPTPGDLRLCGVDLDNAIDASGRVAAWAGEVVERFAAYTERSPSGNGLHVLFLASEADVMALQDEGLLTPGGGAQFGVGNHTEIAFYGGGRYFTVTDDRVSDTDALPIADAATLRWLLAEHGPAFKASGGKPTRAASRADGSGSGAAYRFARDRAREGLSEDEARQALADDDGEAGGWWGRVDDRERDRTVTRAFASVAGEARQRRERLASLFPIIEGDSDDPVERLAALDPEAAALVGYEPKVEAAPLGSFDLDEDGVIRAFTERYAGRLLFDHDAGRWFRFDRHVWRADSTLLAKHYAREVTTTLAKRDPKAKALKQAKTWDAVERFARTVRAFAITSSEWDADPMLLGTPGGVVDLRTGELRPGRADDRITNAAAVAPSDEPDCPQWLTFLDEALGGDADAIRFLRQWAGYCLTGDTSEQVLLFVHGPGGSGKSTAINTLGDVLGDYTRTVEPETLTARRNERHSTELARLRGARLAKSSETEKGSRWAENRIKAMTGGDKLTARFMRQDDFEFTPAFKLTIVGNNRPSLSDVDSAIRRRFLVLPFDHPPGEADPGLPAKLRAEWSGILRWAIGGCLDWQAHRLILPAIVTRTTADYFEEQDTFAAWLDECCVVCSDEADTAANLWASWDRFARGVGEDPGSKTKTFPETMQQRGFERAVNVGPKRTRGFAGVHVRPATDDRFSDVGDHDDLL